MKPCGGCIQARRAIINALPTRIAAPIARVALPTVTTADEVVRVARSFIGVPFLHQGRGRQGIDCVGLPIVVLQELDALPSGFEIIDYPRQPYNGNLEARIRAHCTPLPEPIPGALITLKWKQQLAHVAIFDGENLIHAFERKPHMRVIEHGFRGMWKTKFATGAWALPGVRYG